MPMPTRRFFAASVLGAVVAMPVLAHAATAQDFDAKAFAEAQQTGRPILVAIHAWWCPVCLVQKVIVNTLITARRYDDLAYFVVDYDRGKDQVRRFGAQRQSTLIVYRGRNEMGRSVGETNDGSIAELVAKVL
jgi:thioredoxin 1